MASEPLRESARRWLRRARSNLARSRLSKPEEAVWNDFCFDAQQAAEKSIKAVLISLGCEVPRTHDVRRLLEMVEEQGSEVTETLREAIDLNPYAVEARYPEHTEEVTEEEYLRAVELAARVVSWAEKSVG